MLRSRMKSNPNENNFSSLLSEKLDYKDLLDNYSEDSFLIIDTNLIIVDFGVNFKALYQRYFGRSVKKGNNILDYAPEGRKEIARNAYERALKGETLIIDVDMPINENTRLTCRNKYKPIYNKQKAIVGVFVSAVDMSLLKKAESDIQSHENKCKKIIENSLDAFFLGNLNGDILDVNDSAVEMFGYSIEEFKQLNRKVIIDHTDKEFLRFLDERNRLGRNYGEATAIRKNGERFPVELSSVTYQTSNGEIQVGTFISDISIRKKAEKLLELSERRFRALVENSSDILIVNDKSGNVNYVSPAFEKVTGIYFSELQKNPGLFVSGLHPDNAEKARKTFQESLEKPGIPISCILHFQHKDGHDVYLEGLVTNMLNDENVGAIVSNYQDATERILAEAEVVKNENRFRSLVENASDIIILTDEKGIIEYASPAFEKITGFTFEDSINNPNLFLDCLHPDFLEMAVTTWSEIIQNPGVPIHRLLPLKNKEGQYLWFEGLITNLLHDANVGAIVCNYRDITASKTAEEQKIKSENRFRALIEKGEDIIILTNAEGIISYVSPAFEKLTGYINTEVIGKRNLLFMHEEQAIETESIFEQLLKHPELSVPRLNRLKCKNGTYKWVEGYITNLLNDESVEAIVSNYTDVTERKEALEIIKISESNLKAIFDNTSEAFVLLDTHGKIKTFNTKAYSYGLFNTNTEMMVGRHLLEIIADDRKAIVQSFLDRALQSETIRYDRPYSTHNRLLWINYTISPVIENGQITGICVTGRDITERKEAEEELAKRELKFRSIIANSHDLLVLIDANRSIEFLSPAIQKVFGYMNDETKIPAILDRIHPEDLDNVMTCFKRSFHNPEVPFLCTLRLLNKEDNFLWLEGTLTNMLHKPEINAIVGSFRDITERKLFEEQQDLLVSIINSSEDAILSLDTKKNIISWNKGAARMFGYEDKEIIGNSIYLIVPPERLAEEEEIFNKIYKGEPVNYYETQRINKSGQLLDISITASPIKDNNGNIVGISRIARDVSEKMKAQAKIRDNERRFRSLLQNSNDGLCLMGPDGIMQEISQSGIKILGYEESDLIGQARFDLVHPDDVETVSKAFFDVAKNPKITRYFEYRSLCKDGSYLWLEASCQNLLNDAAVNAIVVNFRDITERKNLDIERENLIYTLNKRNNDLRNFSFITSHNLRAPLSNLLGFIQLLEEIQIEDQVLKVIIDGFRASTLQLSNTLDDLIKILIIKENNTIEYKEVYFEQILLQIKNQLNFLIQEAEADIETHFELAPSVVFTETYMESILMNLMTNALKYRATDRSLKIKIETQKTDKEIVLVFSDNGIGFDVELHKEKLFGLYQRFHDRPNSIGLGLFLVKSQMESLGGTIEVESTVNVGTTFKLRFNRSAT
ncbi:PAS domain-containing sensor histidine kinase [Emticicia sp. 21SJ11W-3]|uniref:PAS domain-containing sensor histidine kinase n=1 Tax=Emticicia sp. 21SJ11W-3 TaxID=2916755 RepID=UPI0020A015E8|nr:PAS domain-containing sensor histidine kinase [Emticicia sp. 21SJ11W-3]UTA66477.1 PAS domain-containing sensor histidine kinase [Emticicia sp. 21SJ11W-3]